LVVTNGSARGYIELLQRSLAMLLRCHCSAGFFCVPAAIFIAVLALNSEIESLAIEKHVLL
jgi:hypothetical protein